MPEGIGTVIVSKLAVPTKNLTLEVIQEVLNKVKSSEAKQSVPDSGWNEIVRLIWDHLQTGLKRLDDQLLCSVCFYTALELSSQKELYLDKVLTLINNELNLKQKLKYEKVEFEELQTIQAVSIMYGMFQSKFVIHVSHKQVPILDDVIHSSFELLLLMAYEYSRYTFVVFKTISCFKIVHGTELQEVLFSKKSNNLIRLKRLVNNNWENPITGVRDLNKAVFHIVILMCGKKFRHSMMQDINKFYWNKAKYLMLAIRIEYPKLCNLKEDWIDGLLHSLNKPGLVSAGADMYYAVLNKLSTEDIWCSLFLNKIILILSGENMKVIENFSNYWCLTTFKKFPSVALILIDELLNYEDTDGKLFSTLCITKQAIKIGVINRNHMSQWKYIEKAVLEGIDYFNPQIRMASFEIITKLGKYMPSSTEYKLILNYLSNNLNSDCTVLRISMLSNINNFLTNLCLLFIHHTKHGKSYDEVGLLNFYKELQGLIINSLTVEGNYQRKSATIKLCNILLSTFAGVPKKRQKQVNTSGLAVMEFLKNRDSLLLYSNDFLKKLFGLLKDPADDVRENTVQLLLDHYSQHITAQLINHLIEDAKTCVRSKFFFEISCGQSIFRLVASLLIKEDYKYSIFKTVDDIFMFAFELLYSECEFKRDIMNSIEDGKQLHAYIGILIVVLKVSKQFSYNIKSLAEKIPQMLKILEYASNQFALEEEPEVSTDFSKMSEMVQGMIASSGYNPLNEKDLAKISGLHQIVLNCMWLNVKASCDLASCLITFFTSNKDAESARLCLGVITTVLETSRHKGAIEAAGAALGRAVQHLTREVALAGAARDALQAALAPAPRASVSRRAAGRAVLAHRLVAADAARDKPLFHYFMKTLLRTCNTVEAVPVDLEDNEKDVPKAVYIHLLTRVVTDSSLASDIMYYSADLAELAFDNLTSPQWQIRNAALQLYGALIPKLIGQKKASGADGESAATVAPDEFLAHFPRLALRMRRCVTRLAPAPAPAPASAHALASHADALPVVNVLANLAQRYAFEDETVLSSPDVFAGLLQLLGSPVYAVRRLAARCISNVYEYEFLDFVSLRMGRNEFGGENSLHGVLRLVRRYARSRIGTERRFRKFLETFRKFVDRGGRARSYVCRKEYDIVYGADSDVRDVLLEVERCRYAPGVFAWANNRMERYIASCSWNKIPGVLKLVLQQSDYELYLQNILNKLKAEDAYPESVLIDVSSILLSFEKKFDSNVVWHMLYEISHIVEIDNIDVCSFEQLLASDISYRARYLVPFLAKMAHKMSKRGLLKLSNMIFSLSDPDKSDANMRNIASLANNELGVVFKNFPDDVRIVAIKTAVLLLQDEDESVRMMNIHFYGMVTKNHLLLHPYICLNKILDRSFLHSHLEDPKKGIPILCEELLGVIESYAKPGDIDEYNPFANDSKNIYFELDVVKKLIERLL